MKERIKAIRNNTGLSQAEFGERIGLKRSAIASYEIGTRTPLDTVMFSLCREYGVNEHWLRTGEGEMYAVKTVEDALGDLFDAVANDQPDAFRKRVFLGLAELSPDDWDVVERTLQNAMGQKE